MAEDTKNTDNAVGNPSKLNGSHLEHSSKSEPEHPPKREQSFITKFQATSIAGWKIDEKELREHIKIYEGGDEKDNRKMAALQQFLNRGDKPPSVFRTNGRRVFNPLTAMKRTMRKLITAQSGNQLLEIDAANSQPLLLVHELIKKGLSVELEIRQAVEDGMFYELFMKNGEKREEVKVEVFRFVFTKELNRKSRIYKILEREHPWFTESLIQFAEGRSVAETLQAIESGIWIDRVSPACKLAGIPHATIHDSVIFEDADGAYGKVRNIVEAAFDGIQPPLHVETLDGKKVDQDWHRNLVWGREIIKRSKDIPYIFWSIDNKGRYVFNMDGVITYLHYIGVFRYYVEKSAGKYIIIRIVDNIVKEIDLATITGLVKKYVYEFGGEIARKSLSGKLKQLVDDASMRQLDAKDISVFRGERDSIYVFYSDAIAVVTKEGVTKIQYADFKKIIWKNTILKRRYPDSVSGKGEFETFFDCVFKDNENRNYVRHIFGYALQRYRSLAQMKSIVITDSNTDDKEMGGTGKGILGQALTQFLSTVKENGKSFKPDVQFSYQNLKLDTRLFIIDDVNKYFDITKMFSFMTDGVHVEKKGKQPFFLDPLDLPVVMLTSNYGLRGSNDSHQRRRLDIGIDKYYSKSKTPEDQFGHILFQDWEDPDEWYRFDRFMLECARLFLQDGLLNFTNPAIAVKQLIADTHSDFVDYADGLAVNEEHMKKVVLAELKDELSRPKLTKSRMTRWLGQYADHKGYGLENNRKNDVFEFVVAIDDDNGPPEVDADVVPPNIDGDDGSPKTDDTDIFEADGSEPKNSDDEPINKHGDDRDEMPYF